MAVLKKKIIFIISLLSVSILLIVGNGYALNEQTHRAINEHLSKNSFSNFSLNDYLKNQLGMPKGYDEKIDKKEVFLWISDGGEEEDAGTRSLNHFLNPITNEGLWGYKSAVAWATLPVGAQPLSPISSWNDVRSYYYLALTSKDKTTRDDNFALTFQGVGQVMHLVEDMSVPAHVRSDIHPPPFWNDGYENWAKKNINDATQVSSSYSSYGNYTPFNTSLFLIPQLFDSTQYDGTNPGITTSSKSIGLAEYTNANFLSASTIFKNFSYPDWSNLQEYEEETAPGKTAIYQKKTGAGVNVDHFVREKIYYDKLPSSDAFRGLMLDDNVHKDYAQFLIPRAIGYSSQVLSYFFRGKLEVEMSDKTLKVKNTSTDTMTGGKFELYYNNANEERNKVTITEGAAVSSLSPGGDPQTITFTAPPDGATSYMLVYSGTLGNETNAVIGKFIPANGEFVVFTVSLSGIPGESLTKKSVLVWDPASNSLERAPIDNADVEFQMWYSTKTDTGNSMFGSFTRDYDHPHKLAPELIDVANMDYHANDNVFPETIYANVLLPPQPPEAGIVYAGLRTSKETLKDLNNVYWRYQLESIEIFEQTDPNNPTPSVSTFWYESVPYNPNATWFDFPPELWQEPHTHPEAPYYAPGIYYFPPLLNYMYLTQDSEWSYVLHGLLSAFPVLKETLNGWVMSGSGGPPSLPGGVYDIYEMTKLFIPNWEAASYRNSSWSDEEWYAKSRRWYDSNIKGKYTDRTIVDIDMVQYTPCTNVVSHNPYPPDPSAPPINENSWSFGKRTIMVQAQALYVTEGTTGYDWVAAGRNTALETQIIAVINMAYSLNGIPANEIRGASISIKIVK